MKTREEQRLILAGVAMHYIGHNFPQLEPADIAARAVERADALLAELDRTATVNQSLTVGLDAMLAACIPGGDTCDPQEVADSIREWYANHIVDANKKVPDLLEIPWTCAKCGKETRNKHGYCDPCTGVKVPDADGWIPHCPGDPMPCGGGLLIHVRFGDGETSEKPKTAGFWRDHPSFWEKDESPGNYIIAWKPAK